MAKQQLLSGAGFTKVDSAILPRLIMSISGLEKQGKSHFGLTAPDPIAYVNTDEGMEGVVQKFGNKRIEVLDVAVPNMENDDIREQQAKTIWEKFEKGYYAALEHKLIRTILIDTATEVWELLRLHKFGKLTQVMPYQYGPVNAVYRRMIRTAYKYDKNVILLHKMKAQYINDKRTSKYERAGFNDTGFLVQLNAQVWKYEDDDDGPGEFAITILDSRHNPELNGEVLEGPMCNFQTLAMMVLPEIDPNVWD